MFGDVSAGGNYPIGKPGGDWRSLVMETVLTAILVSIILNTATGGRSIGHNAAIAVGSTVALLGLFAIPVIAEGPFDAIAITLAGQDRYAGLAPCGTALTSPQIEALSRAADLRQAGILVAFDGDNAGRKAAVRAYRLLRATSDRLGAGREDPCGCRLREDPFNFDGFGYQPSR